MYNFVDEWEPDSLTILEGYENEGTRCGTDEKLEERELRKSCNNCLTAYGEKQVLYFLKTFFHYFPPPKTFCKPFLNE